MSSAEQVPWSRLPGTDIFQAAMEQQARNSRRCFHNDKHVLSLYRHAATTFNFDYDRALDLAILTHDVVFDARPDRELRSISWLRDHLEAGEDDPDFLAASAHIRRTIDHRIDEDPRIVLLDLADFSDPDQSRVNTELLRREAELLHGIAPRNFALGCDGYLQGLQQRFCEAAAQLSPSLQDTHNLICRGICDTRRFLHAEETENRKVFACPNATSRP